MERPRSAAAWAAGGRAAGDGDVRGRGVLIAALQAPSADQRLQALQELDRLHGYGAAPPPHLRPLLDEPRLPDLLLGSLEDSDARVQRAAVQAAGLLAVPGHVLEFRELLHRDGYADRGRIAEYTLRFVQDKRLYEARIRNLEDRYDVERLVTVVNATLEPSGREERFVPLDSGNQTAQFVFGREAAMAQLAASWDLPVDDDLNRPLRTGREYEQRILERDKAGGEPVAQNQLRARWARLRAPVDCLGRLLRWMTGRRRSPGP